jgi:CubicO group peptidase (beta-lactamase class C family)
MLRDLISTADATGDPELVERLAALRARLTHTIAAAVIDLDEQPIARWARLTTNKPRTTTAPEAKVDSDPRFELGSITKALTGMLLADAIERGELALDTTAGEILASDPELATSTEGALHSLTMFELATHTSGLPRLPRTVGTAGRLLRLALLGMDPYRGVSAERVLRLAAAQPLRERGEYRYSNLGGAVAGQLLAIAAGRRYPALLRERIFTPLQMHSSTVATKGDAAARGRSSSGLRRQAWILDGYAPAGGAISTVRDVARLTHALVDGSAPGIASLQALSGAAPSAPGRQAGMFWVIEPLEPARRPDSARDGSESGDGITLTWHNGATAGYSAFVGVVPELGHGVAVLADAARSSDQRAIALELLRSLSPRR